MPTVRVPNIALSPLVAETGRTYSQLARAVNRLGTSTGLALRYDASAVAHWLTGTQPRLRVRRLVLEVLSGRLNRPITAVEAGFPANSGDLEPVSGDTVESLVDLGRADMDPTRRALLEGGLYSVALAIPAWHEVIGRTHRVRTGGGRVGMAEAATVQAMADELSSLDDKFGGGAVRPMAAAYLVNTVAVFLQADASHQARKALLSAAADLAYLTGWMAVDETQNGIAQRYYLQALKLAGAAEDHLTYCTALRGMSVQAVQLGHGQKALDLANAAAEAAPEAGPRMRAFIAGQQAHATAQTGDRHAAFRYLTEAERELDRATSGASAFGSYDGAALHFHTSHVRYELGDLAGSIASMKQANHIREPGYRRSRAIATATIAEREFKVGHLEAACTTWGKFLDDYQHVTSGRCDRHLESMRRNLRPHNGNRMVKALVERTEDVRRNSK